MENQIPTSISTADKIKYDQLFQKADVNKDGIVDGLEGRNFFEYSKLPRENLAVIWSLCDQKAKGHLTRVEFRIAMHLVYCSLKGFSLPTSLPSSLIIAAEGGMSQQERRHARTPSQNLDNNPYNPPIPLPSSIPSSNSSNSLHPPSLLPQFPLSNSTSAQFSSSFPPNQDQNQSLTDLKSAILNSNSGTNQGKGKEIIGKELNPMVLVPMPHLGSLFQRTDQDKAKNIAIDLMKQMFVEMEMGSFSEALTSIESVKVVLRPYQSVLTQEMNTCNIYETALNLLVEIKEADEEEDQVTGAILSRFLAELEMEPKHRIVAMRMAAKKNFTVQNYGIAARFIRSILKLHPVDERSLDSVLVKCQEEGFLDRNVPNYECSRCKNVVSAAPLNCSKCNTPIQANYFLELRKVGKQLRKITPPMARRDNSERDLVHSQLSAEEENRRYAEEEKRRAEELKVEEERKKIQEEKAKEEKRLKEERLKREIEEKRLEAEERMRRKEEEERRKYEEEQKRMKLEQERRIKMDEERKRIDEENRKQMEEAEKRLKEERMQLEEERRKFEEEKRREEERKKSLEIPGVLPLPPVPPSPLFNSIPEAFEENTSENLRKKEEMIQNEEILKRKPAPKLSAPPALSIPPPVLPPKPSFLNTSNSNSEQGSNYNSNSLNHSLPNSILHSNLNLPSQLIQNHPNTLSHSLPSHPAHLPNLMNVSSASTSILDRDNSDPNQISSVSSTFIVHSGNPLAQSLPASNDNAEKARNNNFQPHFLSKKANTLETDELLTKRINDQLLFQLKHKLKSSSSNTKAFNPRKSMDSSGKTIGAIPVLGKRDEIVNEIILTERKYVENLRILIDVFYKPLQESAMIEPSQLRTIFGVVEIIFSTNQVLLSKLEERAKHWNSTHSKIGDNFLEIVPYLKVYTAYVNNANLSIVTVAEISNTDHDFHKFLEDAKNNGGNGLDIQSYLIGPIQRIPRYVLLLKDLFKNTPEDHPDFSDIQKALEDIEKVAVYVNEKKREAENMTTVMRIQSQVIFDSGAKEEPLVQPHRRLIKKGKLVEKDEVSLRKRTRVCFLFNDIFLVTKPRLMSSFGSGKTKGGEDLEGIFSFVKKMHLSRCGVANIFEEKDAEVNDLRKRSFLLYEKFESAKGEGLKDDRGSKKRFVFVASTEEEKLEWVKDINEIIDSLAEKSKKRKEKTSGLLSSDDDLTNDDWTLLLTHGKQKTFKRGESILRANTRNHSIYRIVSGSAKCVLGYKQALSTEYTIPCGGIVGFRAFVGDGHSTQPREILADSDQVVVDYVEVSFVLRLFQVEPQIAERFYGMAARSFERRLVGMESFESRSGEGGSTFVETQDYPSFVPHHDPNKEEDQTDVELKKKNLQFKTLFPQLKEENILREYFCTYKRSLTYYGRIYITGNYIAFFAKLFGVTKQKSIPLESIGKIDKNKTHIDITRVKNDGNFKIARFTFDKKSERDEAFVTIDNLWRNNKEAQGKPPTTPILGKTPEIGNAFHLLQGDLPTKDDWNLMLKDSKQLSFEEGQTVVQEGSGYQKIFQINSGTCHVIKGHGRSDNTSKLLSHLNRGEIFGEISFLEKGEASASVVTATKVELCVIEGDSLLNLFENTPGLRGRFYKYLAGVTEKRLRNREMQFLQLSGGIKC